MYYNAKITGTILIFLMIGIVMIYREIKKSESIVYSYQFMTRIVTSIPDKNHKL
jgi:hypothetical protein